MNRNLEILQEIQKAVKQHGNRDMNNIPVDQLKALLKEAIKLETARPKFPNGFTDWHETHFEIVQFITDRQGRPYQEDTAIYKRQQEQGMGGLYELAQEWTDAFEKEYEGAAWGQDGGLEEWHDTVYEFCEKKNNPQ